ncbi:hypothetical protein FA15DRAFT_583293, partial [Coprinopsis marcescibilis]
SHWEGLDSLSNIVVLGDSYSKSHEGKTWVEFLGQLLSNLPGRESPKIYNFAFPGASVEEGDLAEQVSSILVSKRLTPTVHEHQESGDALWSSPRRTTYCSSLRSHTSRANPDSNLSFVERVFDALHDLYTRAGARSFVVVDVPPTDRSPSAINFEMSDEMEGRICAWNTLLTKQAREFGTTYSEATLLLVSSHNILSDILDDPAKFDFTEDDVAAEGGGIWADILHLTEEVHEVLAEQVLIALSVK